MDNQIYMYICITWLTNRDTDLQFYTHTGTFIELWPYTVVRDGSCVRCLVSNSRADAWWTGSLGRKIETWTMGTHTRELAGACEDGLKLGQFLLPLSRMMWEPGWSWSFFSVSDPLAGFRRWVIQVENYLPCRHENLSTVSRAHTLKGAKEGVLKRVKFVLTAQGRQGQAIPGTPGPPA